MRQKSQDNTTDFVSRLREKATKCKFENNEHNESLIEMVIVSTPVEYLRRQPLLKPKGYLIKDVIERGREHDAEQASQTSLRNMSAPVATTVNVVIRSSYSNRGLHQPPKSCPMYKDRCLARSSVENQDIFQNVDLTKTDSQHQRGKQSQDVVKED